MKSKDVSFQQFILVYFIILELFFAVPAMLDECLEYLEKQLSVDPAATYEVIVVDDGSKDKTSAVALGYSEKYSSDKLRVLTLVQNRGKGGAVRLVSRTRLGRFHYWKALHQTKQDFSI